MLNPDPWATSGQPPGEHNTRLRPVTSIPKQLGHTKSDVTASVLIKEVHNHESQHDRPYFRHTNSSACGRHAAGCDAHYRRRATCGSAFTFKVDTSVDNPALTACTAAPGDCSLRGAITRANANPGLDTITFAAVTNGAPIVLSGAANEDGNASGDLDILDGGDLTIQGNGAVKTIVDGAGIDRVFHVCPSGICANTVTFNDVTIRNGKIVTSVGGGILNGGGMTMVDGCTVILNAAHYGGGVYSTATLTVIDSTIGGTGVANQATESGGGIYNWTGTTMVDGSDISANTSVWHGGGIYNRGTLHVQNGSTLSANTAGDGGGVYTYTGGTTTIDGSTVSANTASIGGGIYNKAALTVRNASTIGGLGTGNQATQEGGGVYNDGGTTTVDHSTVISNTAGDGGGIYNYAGTMTVDGGTVSSNQASIGGGIYNDTGGVTTVHSSTVNDNKANIGGGGIFNYGGTMTVDGSTVNANKASLGGGGGIYNQAGGTIVVDGSSVSANMASIGGGIYNIGTLTAQNGSAVSANRATSHKGGGIYNYSGTTTLDGSTVGANTSLLSGGGIYNRAVLQVQNGSTISANSGEDGGGIYNEAGSTAVVGSCILNNRATNNGGGLYNDRDSPGATDVTGSAIVGNSATSIFNNQAPLQIATGNWWGAATGPNTPGADTVGGPVDASGYLTQPVPTCLYRVNLPLLQKHTP